MMDEGRTSTHTARTKPAIAAAAATAAAGVSRSKGGEVWDQET